MVKLMEKDILAIGEYGCIYTNGEFDRGGTDNGSCYKSQRAFEASNEICYIPELTGHYIEGLYKGDATAPDGTDFYAAVYTREDFLDLVFNNEDLAEILFDGVDWQHPSSYLEELLHCDELFEHKYNKLKKAREKRR